MEKKDTLLVILGVVAILAVVALVFLFRQAMTGQYAAYALPKIYADAGRPQGSIYGPGVPAYSDNCIEQYGQGWVWMQTFPQTWRNDCKQGIRTETWMRAQSGPYPAYENPQIVQTQGWCCPISAIHQ